jgi:exodeoxyribonuclease VII large subunit
VLARTIATLSVPVFTGIGHEVDRSIADEVAHTVHKTPTACAAALVDAVHAFRASVRDLAASLSRATHHALDREATRVHRDTSTAAAAARRGLDRQWWLVGDRAARLAGSAPRRLAHAGAPLDHAATEVGRRATNALARAEARTGALDAGARALDPARLLARGWSITRTTDGAIARAGSLAPGDSVVTTFVDGQVSSTVDSIAADPRRGAP